MDYRTWSCGRIPHLKDGRERVVFFTLTNYSQRPTFRLAGLVLEFAHQVYVGDIN